MTSTSHIKSELKQENIESIKDDPQTQPKIQKIIEDKTDLPECQSEPKASTSEPQENETESLLVKRPGKRKMKKEQVPYKENDRLIQLVRSMRCLYDPQHPRYRDTQVRRDLWNIIGKAMDLPGNECEKRWSALKMKYKNIIKNKKKGYWKITKSLIWYQEYIQIIIDSEVKESLDYPSTSKCSCSVMAHEIDMFLSGLLPTLKSLDPSEQDLAKTQIFDVVRNACEESWQKLILKFKKSKNKNRDFDELMWLLRYISKEETKSVESENYNQNTNSNSNGGVDFLHASDCQCNTAAFAHPMQKFLAEIATMLKKLPPQDQNLAKIEIFEIVHKFDLKKSTEVTVAEIKTEIDSDD